MSLLRFSLLLAFLVTSCFFLSFSAFASLAADFPADESTAFTWGNGVAGVVLSGLLGVAVAALKTFRQSNEFRGMDFKRRMVLDVIRMAVQIAYSKYWKETKEKARNEGRSTTPQEQETARQIARNEARMLAKMYQVHDDPVMENATALNGAIQAEVARVKQPRMRAGRKTV